MGRSASSGGSCDGNPAGWGSPEVVASLALGAALVVGFVLWELRACEPMLPLRFFRSRAFSSGNAGVFFLFASLSARCSSSPSFLQTGLGHGPLEAGLRLAPWTATLFVVAPIAGALADRIGERSLLAGGMALQAVGFAWVALIAEPDLGYTFLIAPLIIAGIDASMAIPPAASSVVGSVTHEVVGKAAGANSMLHELGGVFGIALLVAVFAAAGAIASLGVPGRHRAPATTNCPPKPAPALQK